MSEDPQTTLTDARTWLLSRIVNGARCPCCSQFAKAYRRQINSGMARSLIAIYLHAPDGAWVHIPTKLDARSREEGKLRYWNLVEEQRDVIRDDGGRAGYWRITPRGRQWVTGQITLPKYVTVYNNTVIATYGDEINVQTALGNKFNYAELMNPQRITEPA